MGLEKINAMRKSIGMSIDELSEKSGIPKGTLSKITAGITKDPGIETVKAIVYAMGFSLNDLDNMTINQRIHILRTEHLRIKQVDFARKLGVTPAAISKIEKGDRNVTEQMFLAICREFGVNAIWLETGEGEVFTRNRRSKYVDMIIDLLEDMPDDIRAEAERVIMYMVQQIKKK